MTERGFNHSLPAQGDRHLPSAGHLSASSNSSQVDDWLQRLTLQGIQLWPQDGKLRYAGPQQRITPALLQELKAKKAALLQQLREPTYAPVSYGQRGLWFIHQQSPEAAAYNVSLAYRVSDTLDVDLLQDVLQLLVNRHASLRTRFLWRDDELMQQIDGYQAAAIETVDATDWSDAYLLEQIDEFHQRPFDLATGPLFRTAIFQQGAETYSFVLTAHHIVIDGWSVYQLLDELFTFYTALQQGAVVDLPVLQHTYADYVAWQQSLLTRDGERLAAFWQNQLQGELPVLQLPTDYPRPPQQLLRGISQPLHLSPTLTDQLKRVARENGCTLYTLLLAAYQLLLHRYSGQEEILVGLSTAGRSRPEFAQIIGYFTAPVVARADFRDNPTFADYLAAVNRQVWAALDHQDYPFARLVEDLNPQRDPSRSPIFQASFVLQRAHRGQAMLQQPDESTKTALATEPIPLTLFEGQHDIALELMERPDGLYGHLKGNAALFAATTLERMAGHFQVLLENIVADRPPGVTQPIDQLPLLTETERHQLLVSWASTSSAPDNPLGAFTELSQQCIHQLFEAQVERTPDAIAVQSPKSKVPLVSSDRGTQERLTYRELNARANQLAHYLQSLAVGPETVVGLCVERSVEMVVGLLGILKAGAAYLPLDPTLPSDRLAFLVEDAQVTILLTQQHPVKELPQVAHTLYLDADWTSTIAVNSSQNPHSNATPNNLAYILYTSGSTGNPKGVMVEHRQVVAYGHGVIERCELEPGMRYAMVQSLTVDSSVTMLFPPLWTGGTLHVIDRESVLNASALAATFQQYEIDCLKIAPSHLAALQAAVTDPQAILPRKRLIIGGEASQRKWVQQLANDAPCQVYNHYGPTETTVGVLTYPVRPDPTIDAKGAAAATGTTPIGYPLPNTQAYILDTQLQPVPIGCWGELHIGGALVTRGYLNRPALTAERFIPDPFAPQRQLGDAQENSQAGQHENARLYKTGDWARFLPDGTIEFYGRMDDQVKIRGFRIELGEIEAQLRQHPAVAETIVVVREADRGQKELVAYFVLDSTTDAESHVPKFRSYLQEKLPEYMIPATFVRLDALPLTAHGKVDRKALPAPEQKGKLQPETMAPPTTPIEKELALIWCEVLGVAAAGRHDNFFDRGGHSILAIQLMAKLEQHFARSLPVSALFQRPTIAQLGELLEQERGMAENQTSPEAPLVLIKQGHARPPFFCVHGIAGTVFHLYNLARALDPAQPFYGVQAVGLDQTTPPHTTVEEMAAAYKRAIQQVQPIGPYLLGGHSFGGEIAFELAHQFLQAGDEVALLALFDSYAPGLHAQAKAQIDTLTAATETQASPDAWPELAAIMGHSIRLAVPNPAELSWEKQLQLMATQMQLPPAQAETLLKPGGQQLAGLLQVLQANAQIEYQPTQAIDIPTVLFRAVENPVPATLVGNTLGWERFITSPIAVYDVPGDHFRMLAEPHVQMLASQLMAELKNVAPIS